MSEEHDYTKQALEDYPNLVQENVFGEVTPLVYKFDLEEVCSSLIRYYIESDIAARELLSEYENRTPDMSHGQKAELWDKFSIANQLAALLLGILTDAQVVPDSQNMTYLKADAILNTIDTTRDPEELMGYIQEWVARRSQRNEDEPDKSV